MVYRKDKLKPTQPYFVLDGKNFEQHIYHKDGISHFYSYEIEQGEHFRLVPDGCIDIFVEYDTDRKNVKAFARGTPLKYTEKIMESTSKIFGVRFMPGIHPAIISSEMSKLVDTRLKLKECMSGPDDWIAQIVNATCLEEQVEIFLENYLKAKRNEVKPFGKKEVVQSVKNLVYASDGHMKIADIAERTGYSERYVNKIFIDEMGFSPKTFCKIIQFQRALELLNYGKPESMTEAAIFLGYYDQPQFIRDFAKFAGITPKKYLDMIEKEQYINRVKNL